MKYIFIELCLPKREITPEKKYFRIKVRNVLEVIYGNYSKYLG
jgi:hypothetical protein